MKDFEKIYESYYKRVFLFLLRLTGDDMLAEELTQETFYQAFLSLHRFKGGSSMNTWLDAIAKHAYFKYLKKNRLGIDSIDIQSIVETYCAQEGDIEDAVYRKHVREAVRVIINKVPPKYRDAVILRIYADLPFSQVGKVMNISENSAKVLYHRAKKMLKEELKNEFGM